MLATRDRYVEAYERITGLDLRRLAVVGAVGRRVSVSDVALAADPPAEALHWVTAVVGGGASVLSVAPLAGARSSAVHGLVVELPSGIGPIGWSLRRHVDRDWLVREPDLAEREAEVLAVLESGDVPAPRLVGVDSQGERVRCPVGADVVAGRSAEPAA